MRTSEQTDKIDAAIVAMQQAMGAVEKNKAVDASREEGGRGFRFRFATFASMLATVRPIMAEQGIAFYQGGHFEPGAGWQIATRVSKGGQWVEVSYPIKETGRSGAQGFGGGISFGKRWGLRDILGIEVADDDEEARGYKEAMREAKGATKGRAPAGIAEALAYIRDADGTERLQAIVLRARHAFPTGAEAAQIEREIDAWYLASLGAVTGPEHADRLLTLRASVAAVKPKGSAVLRAIADAEARAKGATS